MENKNRIVQWINTILQELSKFDNNKGVELLHACGEGCLKTSDLLQGALKIRNEFKSSEDLDEIFNAYKKQYYNTTNFKKEGNKITLIFEDCTCPLVKEGVSNPFLCNCTIGYTKNISEILFDRPVKVDLEQSILKGHKICKQVIYIE